MGMGEVIGIMFVVVWALVPCLGWLRKAGSVRTDALQRESRKTVRYRARR